MTSCTSTSLLVGLAEPGNEAAWRRFYTRYTPMLLFYARRVGLSDADAQDMVAETLAEFVRKYRAGQYDKGRGQLKHWLGGIAKKKRLKIVGRRSPVLLGGGDGNHGSAAMLEPAVESGLDEAFEREWEMARLSEALEILRADCEPETYQAFDLYVIKSWPVKKVADFLGVSRNAVYIAKSRSLERLREIVAGLIAEEA